MIPIPKPLSGLLLMIILLFLAKLEAKKILYLSEGTQAILGGLVFVAISIIIVSMFGIIWGI